MLSVAKHPDMNVAGLDPSPFRLRMTLITFVMLSIAKHPGQDFTGFFEALPLRMTL